MSQYTVPNNPAILATQILDLAEQFRRETPEPTFGIARIWDDLRWLFYKPDTLYNPITGAIVTDRRDRHQWATKFAVENYAETGTSVSAARAATALDPGVEPDPATETDRPVLTEEELEAAAEAAVMAYEAAAVRTTEGSALMLGPILIRGKREYLCSLMLMEVTGVDYRVKDWAAHIIGTLDTYYDVSPRPDNYATILFRMTQRDAMALQDALGLGIGTEGGVKQRARWEGKHELGADTPRLHLQIDGATAGHGDMAHCRRPKAEVRLISAAAILKLIYVSDTDPVRAVIRRLNISNCAVAVGNSHKIMNIEEDPATGETLYHFYSMPDWAAFHDNEVVTTWTKVQPAKDGKPEKEPKPKDHGAGTYWCHHRDRRTYKGLRFDPDGRDYPDYFNLFQGFAIAPAPGDWSLMRAHLADNVCGGDPVTLNYLLDWIARLFQYPAKQGETAVILRGKEGVGKGILMEVLRTIIGKQHAKLISHAKHMVGAFNSHLRDCILLCCDEAFHAGDKAGASALKSLVTESTLFIEAKGIDAVSAPNHVHVIMVGNENWVVPAGLESRRWFVLDVLTTQMQNTAYFAAIIKQLDAGGYAAMHHDLVRRDISKFTPQPVPVTAALIDQRMLTMPAEYKWWLECLEGGETWAPWTATAALFEGYKTFSKADREYRAISLTAFGKFLRSIGGTAYRATEKDYTGKIIRTPAYMFGTREEAREAFTKASGIKVDWTDHDGEPQQENVVPFHAAKA